MNNISRNPIEYKKTITSQWGEDGIIEEIFRRIGTENNICVEFGAWDGKHLSNTWNLWHNKGWASILIEGDKERLQSLEENVHGFGKVKVYNIYVSADGINSLDNILTKSNTPPRLDLLSIDVDGDDYYIFQSLEKFTPRVIIIEYNPTVPPELDIVQAPREYFGASALALVNLAKQKGYSFVGCTDTNCFFVLNSDFTKLEIQEPNLNDVFPKKYLTYIITSYDGSAFLSKQPTYAPPYERASIIDPCIGALRGKKKKKHPKLINVGLEKTIPVKIFNS